jgi:hypothetical protein
MGGIADLQSQFSGEELYEMICFQFNDFGVN